MWGIKGNLPLTVFSGVSDSIPSSVDLSVDKRKLHVPASANGSNKIGIRTSRTSSVPVRYPSTQSSVYGFGCRVIVASVGEPPTGRRRQRTISKVTSTRRRVCPSSRRLPLQTTTPRPTTVMNGKHARKVLSAGSKYGANLVRNACILNNVVNRGRVIVDEPIRRSRSGTGERGGAQTWDHVKSPRKFYKPRGNSKVRPIGCRRRFAAPFISSDRVFWPDFGTKRVGDGWGT